MLFLPISPLFFRLWIFILRFVRVIPRTSVLTRTPKRILIVNLTPHVGDIVMMLPFLEKLHAERPEIVLQVALGRPMGSLFSAVDFLECVHEIDFGKSHSFVLDKYARIVKIFQYALRNLVTTRYDLCLLPRWGADPFCSAYLAYLTSAPVRCGQDSREESGLRDTFLGTRFLMTRAIHGGHGLPESVRELRVLSACNLVRPFDEMEVAGQPMGILHAMAEMATTQDLWIRLGLSPESRFGVIAPGASAAFRRWPLEYFAEVAALLDSEFGISFIALGSAAERDIGAKLEGLSDGKIRSFVGATSLMETMAVMKHANVFVGNDSGPAHIAAGLGVPSVVISVWPLATSPKGASTFLRVRPVGPNVGVLRPQACTGPCVIYCSSDIPHCILSIRPEQVRDQAASWLRSCPH
jgi:ADP-heptose:LPS heptosyltransferase